MVMVHWLACCLVVGADTPAGPAGNGPGLKQIQGLLPAEVRLTGWLGGRIEANRKNRLMTVSLEERLRTFRDPSESDGWSGEHIGKWLHAAAITYGSTRDPALKQRMDEAVATLIACQGPDGYLGTYVKDKRWGGWDVWTHKYNLIGLLAYYQFTGDRKALGAARKIGDLLADTFGEGKRDLVASGTHVGMAATSVLEPVVLLHQATRDPRYLEFAGYITRAYDQPHGPKIIATLTETGSVARTANRKAYEMMSNLVGLCELYRATGNDKFLKPAVNAFHDIVENQMYITGGTSLSEHFQKPHQLPNGGAVSENCAQVTWMQLCMELLAITGQAQYADVLERLIYNHLTASQQPAGDKLCYFTPLQGRKPYDAGMNCCTSSGARGLAMIEAVAYQATAESLTVSLYESSTAETVLHGVKTRLTQQTRYPLEGNIELRIEPEKSVRFELRVRIPGWCRAGKVAINGELVKGQPVRPGTYVSVTREWQPNDRVQLTFEMPAVLIRGSHSNDGLVAVERGPLVLAMDRRLNPGLVPSRVSPSVEQDGTGGYVLAADPEGMAAHVFRGSGQTLAVEDGKVVRKEVPLVLTSFTETGSTGSHYAVWLPAVERLKTSGTSPFLLASETFSHEGNLSGSIADGDTSTWRVTFDNRKHGEDWFAVELPQPVTIDSVVFSHGHVYHDGGWFDASKGKPRIQVRKTAGGAWEDAAVLEAYPATTATDPKGLQDGHEFAVRLPPTKVVGLRVIGVGACGDNPRQNFASCAELRGVMKETK